MIGALIVTTSLCAIGLYSDSLFVFMLGFPVLASCAPAAARRVGFTTLGWQRLGLFGLAMTVLLLALRWGSLVTSRRLGQKPAFNINLTSGTVQSIHVRSGERGVLFFVPSTKKFHFAKWEC
ncbi:hypothetical protein XH83_27165 [Bradyrhizobium sp. CCBAU 53351]|nr:hypothetical protein XH83_27165 [Bradyrhizobium sp. CCBAU 53351]